MRRTAILEGVRMMRFLDVFGRCERRELSRLEAAELLGVNERTLRRWCRRFEAEGEAGLVTSPFVTTRKQLESEIHWRRCINRVGRPADGFLERLPPDVCVQAPPVSGRDRPALRPLVLPLRHQLPGP